MNDQHSQPEVLDLRSYLRPVVRRKWIVLAITVLAAGATYLVSSHQQKTYAASTRLYVTDADPTLNITSPGSFGTPTAASVANVAQLITAQDVTNAVARLLGMPVSAAGSVTATASTNSSFVTVTATSQSPVLAARLANAYLRTFLKSRAQAVSAEARRDERAAQITLATLPRSSRGASGSSQRQTLLQEIETYRQVELNPSAGARQIDTAAVPGSPSSPHPKRDAIFGGVVGLVLGVIAAFCIDLLDRRLVSVAALEAIFGRPVLAVLPHVDDPTPMLEGQRAVVPPEFVEELRSLTVMLRLAGNSEAPRVIMVTSTLPREGKSTITRDLALVYAESGERVLVIDGDLRRPSVERLFGIEAERGLVQILHGEASLSDVAVVAIAASRGAEASTNGHPPVSLPANPGPAHVFTGGKSARPPRSESFGSGDPGLPGSVDLVAHGELLGSPLALMSSKRMVALFKEASNIYDIVLLDTPPVLTVADSVPLMEVVDSVLLVARLGQTTRQAAARFRTLVGRLSNATFSGVIANDRRAQFGDEGYGSYGSYARYDHDDDRQRRTREQKKDGASEDRAGTTAS